MCAELKKHEQKKMHDKQLKYKKSIMYNAPKEKKNCDFQLEKFPNEHSQF